MRGATLADGPGLAVFFERMFSYFHPPSFTATEKGRHVCSIRPWETWLHYGLQQASTKSYRFEVTRYRPNLNAPSTRDTKKCGYRIKLPDKWWRKTEQLNHAYSRTRELGFTTFCLSDLAGLLRMCRIATNGKRALCKPKKHWYIPTL